MNRVVDVLAALVDADVDFVVVGGVAVVLRGHPRTTVDVDLALDPDRRNVSRAIGVLTDLGLTPRLPVAALEFADPEVREAWVRDRNLVAFTMLDPNNALLEVDLLAVTPLTYEEISADAEVLTVGGARVPVASINHLIAMKRGTGRPQDSADIRALQAIVGKDDDADR